MPRPAKRATDGWPASFPRPDANGTASGTTDDAAIDPALRPLLRWAEPLLAPARERSLRAWAGAARRHPGWFDGERLAASVRAAFAAPALAWSARALLLELAIARHQGSLEGDTPEQRFAFFLDWIDGPAGRAVLEARYPLLQADIVGQSERTERFLASFLHRVEQDFPALPGLFDGAREPGRLRRFAMGQGDRHDHGGSVVELGFEQGRALYKPRSLAMDVAYAHWLARIAELGVEPDQRATGSLDRGGHGYAGWIEHAPLADAAAAPRYFRRYGGVIAIAYLLNCTDLHLENLVACGEYPVLVDLETVCQPWIGQRSAREREGMAYAPSVLVSGLLPGQLSHLDAWDVSALAWAEHRYQVRRAVGAGTDGLKLAPTEAASKPKANLPHLGDGRRVAAHDHVEAIVEGFEATYRGLRRLKPELRGERGLLAPFARLETRIVLRSTQIYARLIDAMAHPQYLRSAGEREAVLAKLDLGSRQWPLLERVQAAERAALSRGDVPRFLARVDDVDARDVDGHVAAKLCERSGWDEVQRRLRVLSPRDLRRQRHALVQSLECDRLAAIAGGRVIERSRPVPAMRRWRGGDFLDTATRLGDDLLALAFRDRRGLVFFHPEYRDKEHASVSVMGPSLYEGLPGVLLLFAELGRLGGQRRFADAVEAGLATCRRQLRDDPDALPSIGAYDGLAGWLYVLLALGVRGRREALVDEALGWVPQLAARIGADEHLDLVGGAAGCLLVLLELLRHRPDDGAMAAARDCARRLADTAQRDGDAACWTVPASQGRALGGFAHGSAGIGAALARYGHLAGDAEAVALARAALRHERLAFARRGRRWYDRYVEPDGREDVHSWCHGAPGVGLARLLWPDALRDAAWREEMAACVAAVRERGIAGEPSHALCHGRLGNLELLLEYGVCQGDAQAIADARRLGRQALEDGRKGWIGGVPSAAQEPLGLMVGMAGIAYGCLRLADPARVPSVLGLSVGAPSPA